MHINHIRSLCAATTVEKVFLLGGAPGTGKTSFAHWFAEKKGARMVQYLCHAWSGDEDLFAGVNIPAVVAGDASHAIQPGILAETARMSLEGPVVLLIDELDKAPARFEALLLGFLERWEVPLPGGRVMLANVENIHVFITHNGMREISHPLQRRAFRFEMPFLPRDVEVSLLGGGRLVSLVVKIASDMRANDALSSPSLSEMRRLLALLPLAESKEDVVVFAQGSLSKTEDDKKWLSARIPAIWQVVKEGR